MRVCWVVVCACLFGCSKEETCTPFEFNEELDRCVCPGTSIPPSSDGMCPSDAGNDTADPRDAGVDALDAEDAETDVSSDSEPPDVPVDAGIVACNPAEALCNVRQVCAGERYTCAITVETERRVVCWGDNSAGVVGDPATFGDVASTPTVILRDGDPLEATAIACGRAHVCALDAAASVVVCWGDGRVGQLGNGDVVSIPTPTRTTPELGAAFTIHAGGASSCATLSDGTAWCWGDNRLGQFGSGPPTEMINVPTRAPEFDDADELELGGNQFACGRHGTTMFCSGNNFSGQLGDGTNDTTDSIVTVDIAGASALDTGYWSTCAIRATDDQVFCWGDNRETDLGRPPPIGSNVPVSMGLPLGALHIHSGRHHHCAAYDDAIWCWGRNEFGTLGDGTLGDGTTVARDAPVELTVIDPPRATSMALGWDHSCALLENGGVACWGQGTDGQLGNGGLGNSTTATTVVPPS